MDLAQKVVKHRMCHARHPSTFIPIQFGAHNLGWKRGRGVSTCLEHNPKYLRAWQFFRKNSKIVSRKIVKYVITREGQLI